MSDPEILCHTLKFSLQWSDFARMAFIAMGTYGPIYRYRSEKDQLEVAVKFIRIERNKPKYRSFQKEIEFLFLLHNKHSNRQYFPIFYGFVEYLDEKDEGFVNFLLLFELANGNLRTLAVKNDKRLSYHKTLILFQTILKGLGILRGYGVAHQNLKPENVLFFRKGEKIYFKLSDFGEIRVGDNGDLLGNALFLAPEVNYAYLNGRTLNISNTNPYKWDIYALGLMVLFVNMNRSPFENKVEKINDTLRTDFELNNSGNRKLEDPRRKKKEARVEELGGIRWKEKSLDPHSHDQGPYDLEIAGLVHGFGEKYHYKAGIKELKDLVKRCLRYNPKSRGSLRKTSRAFEKLRAETNEFFTMKKRVKELEAMLRKKERGIEIEPQSLGDEGMGRQAEGKKDRKLRKSERKMKEKMEAQRERREVVLVESDVDAGLGENGGLTGDVVEANVDRFLMENMIAEPLKSPEIREFGRNINGFLEENGNTRPMTIYDPMGTNKNDKNAANPSILENLTKNNLSSIKISLENQLKKQSTLISGRFNPQKPGDQGNAPQYLGFVPQANEGKIEKFAIMHRSIQKNARKLKKKPQKTLQTQKIQKKHFLAQELNSKPIEILEDEAQKKELKNPLHMLITARENFLESNPEENSDSEEKKASLSRIKSLITSETEQTKPKDPDGFSKSSVLAKLISSGVSLETDKKPAYEIPEPPKNERTFQKALEREELQMRIKEQLHNAKMISEKKEAVSSEKSTKETTSVTVKSGIEPKSQRAPKQNNPIKGQERKPFELMMTNKPPTNTTKTQSKPLIPLSSILESMDQKPKDPEPRAIEPASWPKDPKPDPEKSQAFRSSPPPELTVQGSDNPVQRPIVESNSIKTPQKIDANQPKPQATKPKENPLQSSEHRSSITNIDQETNFSDTVPSKPSCESCSRALKPESLIPFTCEHRFCLDCVSDNIESILKNVNSERFLTCLRGICKRSCDFSKIQKRLSGELSESLRNVIVGVERMKEHLRCNQVKECPICHRSVRGWDKITRCEAAECSQRKTLFCSYCGELLGKASFKGHFRNEVCLKLLRIRDFAEKKIENCVFCQRKVGIGHFKVRIQEIDSFLICDSGGLSVYCLFCSRSLSSFKSLIPHIIQLHSSFFKEKLDINSQEIVLRSFDGKSTPRLIDIDDEAIRREVFCCMACRKDVKEHRMFRMGTEVMVVCGESVQRMLRCVKCQNSVEWDNLIFHMRRFHV